MKKIYGVCSLIILLLCVYIFYSYTNVSLRSKKTFSNIHLSADDTYIQSLKKNPRSTSERLPIENSHFTSRTRGAILWPYFHNGLTNQRIRLKDAIFTAARLNRSIILPSWVLSRRTFIPKWTEVPWKKILLMHVYDIEYLILCLRKLDIKALYPCLPETCLPGFKPPILPPAAMSNDYYRSFPFVVGKFDPFYAALPPPQSAFRHKIDACIKWSPEIENLGQNLLEDIGIISGRSDLSNVYGLHLRVEDDFATYMMSGTEQPDYNDATTLQSIDNEIIDGALDCFDFHLKHVNFSQSWVYIASGLSRNSSKLITILRYFPLVITKENLSQTVTDSGMDFGPVNSYILEHLPFFIGFSASTFAVQVGENRRLKHLPSVLYTLGTSDNCPIFDTWERW